MRDDRARLEDILQAIGSIARYAVRGRPAFDRDELVQSWMVYHLTLIGEAAARLSSGLRDRHPEIPWLRVIGMRNILIHGYFAIEMILREDASTGPGIVSERQAAYRLAH